MIIVQRVQVPLPRIKQEAILGVLLSEDELGQIM